MNTSPSQFRRWFAVAWVCALSAGAMAAEPFNADELSRFLADAVPFLEWSRTNQQEKMFERMMKEPKAIAEFPDAVRFLEERKWAPERFAYILNHVVVAGKRLGMGRDPSRLLARLEESKVAVERDLTQTDAQKARTLAVVAESQREVARTDRAFAELPAEEVRLLWLHRKALQQALEGRLPMRPRVMPNPGKTTSTASGLHPWAILSRRVQLSEDHVHRAGHRALVLLDDPFCRGSQAFPPRRVGQQPSDAFFKFAGVGHLNRASAGNENASCIAKVLHVRAKDDRLRQRRRLDRVLASVCR